VTPATPDVAGHRYRPVRSQDRDALPWRRPTHPWVVAIIDDTESFENYALEWLELRIDLAERTRELYAWLLRRHILPTFAGSSLGEVRTPDVRRWHVGIASTHPSTAAKAYRLLSQIMRSAVTDELIAKNPCQVRGAAVERSPERPVASIAEVEAMADAMPVGLRIAVVLAAWSQLRRGEVRGLRRMDVDLEGGLLSVQVTRTTAMSGRTIMKEPKTRAGRRTIAIPPNALEALRSHVHDHVGPEEEAWVVSESNHALSVAWAAARAAIGREDLRFHDLRHSGLTWSAATGASVAELMRRAGHASQAAALRYQHATNDRDRAIAEALAKLADIA
jgi:integrase